MPRSSNEAGDLVRSNEQITVALHRSTDELIAVREAAEEAVLSLEHDIDSLLGELKKELRLEAC